MTRAEHLLVVATIALAMAITAGYAIDLAGFGVRPMPVLAIALAGAAALAWFAPRSRHRDAGDVLAVAGIVLFVVAEIARIGWPALLPPGRGPDLTHHLLLVDYIEQNHHLVHDRSLDGSMGEMAHYTPGAHLLAVLIGAWSGRDGLRVLLPLLVFTTALSAGFVFLIARRLRLPIPYAITAAILLFWPAQYFYGAFTHDSFLAQAVATFFAVAAWWALVAWDEERSTIGAVIIGVLLVAVFLTWPIWIGPPVLVFLSLALGPAAGSASAEATEQVSRRLRCLTIGLAPLVVVASMHAVGRWGWLVIVRTSGAVLEPSLANLGWALPLLAFAGVAAGMRDRRARVTIVLWLLIGLQALTLFVIAKAQGAHTPYMAFKMVYLAIYPAVVLAALALAQIRRVIGLWDVPAGWILAALLVVAAARPALTAPRVIPVIDLDLYDAGKWTRANVGQTCVDYLVADADTAYWLHLAVLGNPRSSARMIEIDRYDPRTAAGPWITAEGRSHAIADLRRLPDEVRSRVEIVKQFGSAAVIRKPGAGTCR